MTYLQLGLNGCCAKKRDDKDRVMISLLGKKIMGALLYKSYTTNCI